MEEKILNKMPDIEQLEQELVREKKRTSMKKLLVGILCALVVIAAAVTTVVNVFPVYRVHGSSMSPLLTAGDTVVCVKGDRYAAGDVVAIEFEGKILIKRIVAGGMDRVEMYENGALYINGELLDEPYVTNNESDGEYFATSVPKNEWYVMGDNRGVSGDSRLSEMGTVTDRQIIGRVVFRVWPINKMGTIS